MKKLSSLIKNTLLILMSMFLMLACSKTEKPLTSRTEIISANWKMQPIDKLDGVEEKAISENGFNTGEWFDAVVPGTVLGSMASTGVIEDPYFGINMQEVEYEQFKQPWWFRTSFSLSASSFSFRASLESPGHSFKNVFAREF